MAEKKRVALLIFGGCGCVTAIFIGILTVAGIAGYTAVDNAAREAGFEDLGEFGEMFETASKATESTSGGSGGEGSGGEGSGAAEIEKQLSDDAVDPQKLREAIRTPLTKDEVETYVETIESVRESKAYREMTAEFESLRESGKKRSEEMSVMEKMRAAKGMMGAYSAGREIWEKIDAEIVERGGYPAHFRRMAKVSGVVVAAVEHGGEDPASDATAKKLLELQPEKAEEFAEIDEVISSPGALDSKDKEKVRRTMTRLQTMQNPADIALGRMPRESFELWAGLPKKLRDRAIDAHGRKDDAWSIFGSANIARGEGLLLMAEMEKLNKLSPSTK